MNSLAQPPPFHNSAPGYPSFAYPGQQQQQQQQPQGNFYPPQFAGQGFGYGANDGAGGSSSTPPPGGMLQGPPANYTTAPSQSTPAPQQQQPPQHIRQSASPLQQQQFQPPPQSRPSPPNALPQNPTPPTKYPMAAPPLPNTPGSATNPTGATSSSPRTPLSPASESREQQRIAHLFALNSALLSEIASLQSSGSGGCLNPAQAEQARQKGQPDKMASEDYIHTMRRTQANIQYLMSRQQGQNGGKQLPGPAIMTPPPHLSDKLRAEYDRLRELFPDWMGIEGRPGVGTPGRTNSGPGQGQMQPPQQQQ